MKKNICKYCNQSFTPSKTHPNQSCCGSQACLQASNSARQRRFYRKKCKEDSDWQKKMSKRKKKERLRRQNSSLTDKPSEPQLPLVRLSLEHESLIVGLLSSFTGCRNSEELLKYRHRCMEVGMDLIRPAP